MLPTDITRVGTPPLKCQGIKTKLVPFIARSIEWMPGLDGRWIEPFLGSGVVAFNLAPINALLADANPHIIRLYLAIQVGEMTPAGVRDFLAAEGEKLAAGGADYYYAVRDRFNSDHSPFDFLFLNRACFNGMVRFNKGGGFNVPFCRKPGRFAQAYVTRITNQVRWIATRMRGRNWTFRVAHWQDVLAEAAPDDFVYLDPPYIGRHVDYYSSWSDADATELADVAKSLPCGFALSMWLENKYRTNTHIEKDWGGLEMRTYRHFYHVGSHESLRNEMNEALVIKPGYSANDTSYAPDIPAFTNSNTQSAIEPCSTDIP